MATADHAKVGIGIAVAGGMKIVEPIRAVAAALARETGESMETFRVEVGHVNQVKPGNLVAQSPTKPASVVPRIGRIDIYDDYSTVDLPVGMPQQMFHDLKKSSGRRAATRYLAATRGTRRGARLSRPRKIEKAEEGETQRFFRDGVVVAAERMSRWHC